MTVGSTTIDKPFQLLEQEETSTQMVKKTKMPTEELKTDNLILCTLVNYMANGLIGPFFVSVSHPPLLLRVLKGRKDCYLITGPDKTNRLKLNFSEKQMADDICGALNRAYGYEEINHWVATRK